MNDISRKKLGRFIIKDEDETESISAGRLFAHRKDLDTLSPNIVNPSKKVSGSVQQVGTLASTKKEVSLNKMDKPLKQLQTRSPDASVKDEVNGSSSRDNSTKQKVSTPIKNHKKKEGSLKRPKLIGKPFAQLLEGVVLVISGYQNPHRSNLRTMALEMGARYKPDWDNTCTHLICAFTNTPKFQKVWGKGYIVRKEWIENCHSKRKRLPWRRYALDKRDLSKPESEDEIPELEQDSSPDENSDNGHSHSESDTEDEIERTRRIIPSGDETDIDSETDLPDTSSIPLPHLPSLFSGKYFYLSDELCQETKSKLLRYIVALDGLVSDSSEDDQVDFIISERKVKSKHLVVRPEWIWECNDAERLLPTKMFQIS